MNAVDRAADTLRRTELRPLLDELVRRWESGSAPLWITLADLPDSSRAALADLLGSDRLPPRTYRYSVPRIAAALGIEPDQLRATVEQAHGPLADRRSERSAARAAVEGLWDWLSVQAAAIDLGQGAGDRDEGKGALAGWVDAQRSAGPKGGVAAARSRLQRALAVLRALPADDRISLAAFAHDVLGDPHALDTGRAVAHTVLDAIARVTGLPKAESATEVRALWESMGVVPDPLSSTVLALGLPGGADDPVGAWLAAARAESEPVVLTLANLQRWPLPPLPAGERLYVVENPSVLIAAAGDWDGPPILCSSGQPSLAVITVLAQLTAGGAIAYQHADFDPAGLAITAWLARRARTIPWRMTASAYLGARGRADPLVAPTVPETPWDPDLQPTMLSHRRPVYEEQLRSELLTAMRADRGGPDQGHSTQR